MAPPCSPDCRRRDVHWHLERAGDVRPTASSNESLMNIVLTAVIALTIVASTATAQDAIMSRVSTRLSAMQPELVAFRRDLHRHPEASGDEVRTAQRVAARLRALGLEVRTGIGGHGVVGVLRGGKPGPVVAYRADMDAVRTNDPDPVAFRSTTPGVRHICGHDLHTTIGLALASALHAVRQELPGTVVFIFQPAEERATGANAMLAAGVLDNPTAVAIYGLHTAPLNVGQLATISGDLMSGRDGFRIALSGRGDRAAAARAISQILDSLGTIARTQSFAPAPRDLIMLESSSDTNTGDARVLFGTIMATSLSRPRVMTAMADIRALAIPDVSVTVTYQPKVTAGVTNDAALTQRAVDAVAGALGPGATIEMTQIIPAFSEDFGAFQDRVPGVFFFLGVSNPAKGTVGMPHTAEYVADERAIQIGARAMAAVILERLRR